MEENVNEVLGVASEDKPDPQTVQEKTQNDSAEKTLNIVADILLALGIVSTLVCAFTICFVETLKPGYYTVTETSFNPTGFAITVAIFLSSLASWSIMRVVANISLTLKEINKKVKE